MLRHAKTYHAMPCHAMPCHAQLKQYSCRSSSLCTCSSSSSSLISSTLIYFRRSRKCNRLQMERTWCSAWEKQLIQSLAKAGWCLHAASLRWSIRSKMEMNRKHRTMRKNFKLRQRQILTFGTTYWEREFLTPGQGTGNCRNGVQVKKFKIADNLFSKC